MQSTTAQAAPVVAAANALDPDTLSDLFIADAALRRLCDCLALQRHPVPGFATPALSQAVLHLIVEDISERVAACTHAWLAAPVAQP